MIDLDKIGKKSGMDDYFVPLISSFTLHIIILLFIAFGWEASVAKPQEQKPQYIKAQLVKLDPPKPSVKTEEKKPKPPKPKPLTVDQEKQKAEQRRKLAEQKKAEAERKAAEARKKEAAEKAEEARKLAAKQKAESEKKAAELARKKAEQAKKAAETKALEEQKAREALARKQAEEELLLALAEEEAYQQQLREDEIAQDYASLIRQRVEQAWSRPASARRGMEVLLEITLVPTGYVVNVTVLKESGNPAFDRSAEQAVRKVEKFEELKDMPPAVFESRFRQFRLLFRPEDKPS